MEIIRNFNLLIALPFILIWIVILTFLRLKKKESLTYLAFFSIFYIYLFKVLDYTLFPFQSLLILKHFMPDLMLRGQEAGKTINIVPIITLTSSDVNTSLLNILLFIPFGFGLPFITKFRMKKVALTGFLVSLSIELLQLVTGLIAKTTFRIADVNDVIFNTLGVLVGYVLFTGFLRIFLHVSHKWKKTNPVLKYIAGRPQIS